jgi:hypothetical protein
LENNL